MNQIHLDQIKHNFNKLLSVINSFNYDAAKVKGIDLNLTINNIMVFLRLEQQEIDDQKVKELIEDINFPKLPRYLNIYSPTFLN